jgi:NTP pyrophosphatase (non-canonical NTP hydrolase)
MNSKLKQVRKWGEGKDIIIPSNKDQALKQVDKLQEELEELRAEIEAGEIYKAMMELGDCIVVAEMIAANLQTTQEDCLTLAWDKIKDRKGKTINGTFVKESDL